MWQTLFLIVRTLEEIESPEEYLNGEGIDFAFYGDFMDAGDIKKRVLVGAVASGRVCFGRWPRSEFQHVLKLNEGEIFTDVFWLNNPKKISKLNEITQGIIDGCKSKGIRECNYTEAGAILGSQSEAVAGLVFGREKGLFSEVPTTHNIQGIKYPFNA